MAAHGLHQEIKDWSSKDNGNLKKKLNLLNYNFKLISFLNIF